MLNTSIYRSTIVRAAFFAFALSLVSILIGNADASEQPLRLIQTGPDTKIWLKAAQIDELVRQSHEAGHCGGFLDITEHPNKRRLFLEPLGIFENREPRQQARLGLLIPELSAVNLLATVNHLSSYHTRYYQSDTGVTSSRWIQDRFTELGRARSDVTVTAFRHNFKQPSVIARIAGNGPLAHEVVVLGAHQDSIAGSLWPDANARAPGADDDASGVATLIETFRVLMQSGYAPERTIEFMAYAGEERGLLGSQDIAERYQAEGKQVVAVMQLDMTLFPGRGGKPVAIHLVTDHTNAELNRFTLKLIDTYVKMPWNEMKCGYACSDHASWTESGYPATFPFEALMEDDNPNIHTAKDTVTDGRLDAAFGLHFVKLATSFAVELASE